MPPKKKRGGISTRGRRGRPPKNAATPADTASPLPDLVETSNSSSPMSEDNNHMEMRQKLEMKIHKKFGIKYHVPDEILPPRITVSPTANCIQSSASEEVAISTAPECLPPECATDMDQTDASAISEVSEPQRDELEIKLEQLEVDDHEIEYEVVEDMSVVGFSTYIEEVDSSSIPAAQEDSEFVDSDGQVVELHPEESSDVYYVLEDSDELPEHEIVHNSPQNLLTESHLDEFFESSLSLVKEELNGSEMAADSYEVMPEAMSRELEVKTEAEETPELNFLEATLEELEDVKPSSLAMPIKSKAALKEYSIEEQIQALSEGGAPNLEESSIISDTAEENKLSTKTNGKKARPKKSPNDGKSTTPKKSKRVALKVSPKGAKKPAKDPAVKKCNEEDPNVRRSSRIKTISTQKARARGKGLVKKEGDVEPKVPEGAPEVFAVPSNSSSSTEDVKPVKVKSRWRRSSELEMRDNDKASVEGDLPPQDSGERQKRDAAEIERRLKQFAHLRENVYLTERISCKEAKKMVCDCFLTQEEIEQGEYGCGDDCLNRLLMIECGSLCAVGERCTNKRFQRFERAQVEAFCTEKKGLGIRAVATILSGDFILEYVGEVLDPKKFGKRAAEYSKDKNQHHYFMSLRADAVIDATSKGNVSRFINHSCEPNAETQKWTVNGELRIGFFSKRTIQPGEEITFDYQFQRYGKEAQKCFCEAPTCRGWLGEEPDDDDDDDDEEDDEDDEEEEDEDEDEANALEAASSKSSELLAASQLAEAKVKKRATIKRERRIRKRRERKPRKDIFEDVGIDDEIQSLQQTGLKNQAQTLKLSRLMVRAKEGTQRIKVLKLLKKGEFPCRRLFLDYHGLRLIYGWMTDAQQMAKCANAYAFANSLKLEILQTLAMLPIPNKTMLQDSKVLPAVEKWSVKEEQCSPDSNGNSPSASERELGAVEPSEKKYEWRGVAEDSVAHLAEEIRRSAGMDAAYTSLLPASSHASLKDELLDLFADTFVPLDVPRKPLKPLVQPQPKYDLVEEIIGLAIKLLEEWASLKEVFRIPKKERIEQMKEHEREADLRYQALSVEAACTDRRRDRYRSFQRPICDRSKDYRPKNDRFAVKPPAMSKHERRELFARQAEEEERRRKQELWNQHYKQFAMPPPDPRLAAFDPTRPPFVWNAQLGRWQPAEMLPPHLPYAHRPPGHMEPPNLAQPHMQHANMGAMPPMPNIPPGPDGPDGIDPSKVQFLGPIPPPVKLPPKWKRAKDKYGRPYYYHIKIRKAQWEPPPLDAVDEELSPSSSDTSSLSSSSASDDSESEDDMQLILDIHEKFRLEAQSKVAQEELYPPLITTTSLEEMSPSTPVKAALPNEEVPEGTPPIADDTLNLSAEMLNNAIDAELLNISLEKEKEIISEPLVKKRRVGLVQQLIISPRSEEDRLQYREEARKYRLNKELVRKEKEMQAKQEKCAKIERPKCQKKVSTKVKLREMEANTNSDEAKKVKETFRAAMATVMVNILNPYRRTDCKEARITSTEDFKHLARKLTHFVMLKELKHCDRLQDLECTESVKLKAKEFVRKYMSKFGDVYRKPPDEIDNFN